MMVCRTCGTELPEGARFCPNCGTPVADAAGGGRERKLVTLLFADVTGSTTLGERLDPERMREVMDAFFAAMRGEIEAQGGTVEKFIGDAVMAAFGVPSAHEDDSARALRAALHMLTRLAELNQDLERDHGVTLEVRIGVNTGEVVATTEPMPGEPMVTGDAVNAAARLETAASPGEVLASERTVRAVRGFRIEDVGALELKGKAEPVHAFRVLEETVAMPERGVPGLHAPLVGRDRELDLLRSVYERSAAEGRPNFVTIYGEPGVGKSRLVHEFVTGSAAADGATVLRGRCLPYGDGITYWPLAEILKTWAGVFDDDEPSVVVGKIAAAAAPVLTEAFHPDPTRAAAALAHTVGVENPSARFDDLDPRRVREETHDAWRSFFSAVAAAGPLIVIVEDIHWADPAMLDLLEMLSDRIVGPAVFLCPSRPELVERRPGWGAGRRNVSTIALEPLSLGDSQALIELLLAVDDLPDALRGRILARAEGNPFFLEEIVRHLIDEGRIHRQGDRWRAIPGIGDVEVPDTIQGVLAARIDLLEAAHKRALQRAAVVGRVFWPGPVRRLLNGDADQLGVALDQLAARDLVLPRLASSFVGEREFIFKHVLIRDVAYQSLPRRDRAGAHREVARWLEETAGERRDEFVELLAHHYGSAFRDARDQTDAAGAEELRGKAFEHTLAASRAARRTVALSRAQQLAREAIELAGDPIERSDGLEALGLACTDDYRGDEAYRAFRDAADLRLRADPDGPHIAMLCARTVEVPTRWPGIMTLVPPADEVARYLELGLAHLPDGDSEERVRLLTARAFLPFVAFGAGYDDAALEQTRLAGEEAARIARRMGRRELESASLDAVGAALQMAGRYAAIEPVLERRLDLALRIDDPAELADTYSGAANSWINLGRYREALEIADRGVEVAFDLAPSYGGYSLVWSLVAAFRLGDWDEALERFERLQRFLGGRAPTRPWLQGLAVAAFVGDARGDRLEADRLIETVLEGAATQSYRSVTGASIVARILARRGEHAAARELVEAMTLRETLVLAAEARCEQLAEEGAWDRLDDALALALAARERTGSPVVDIYAIRLRGRAASARGELDDATAALSSAREGFARCEAAWEAACSDLSLGATLMEAGRPDEARVALGRAREPLERSGARRELTVLRELDGRVE